MISLILAILSSSMVSIMMRVGEARCGSKMGLLVSNYTVCTLLGGAFTITGGISETTEGLPFAAALGIFGGFLFLYSLVLYQKSIARNGVILSATFMKLGVLVPTLAAILIFHEETKVLQLVGIAVAVAAIVLMNYEKGAGSSASGKALPLLLLLMLVCGGTDTLTDVYDKMGVSGWKNLFLLVIFFTALVCSGFLLLREGGRLNRWDLLCGIGVGIPNYFSSRFLLAALNSGLSGSVVFPVYSTATILLISMAGALFFRERLSTRKSAALAMILAALVLLNL